MHRPSPQVVGTFGFASGPTQKKKMTVSGEETSESQRLVQGGPPMIWSLIKII